MLVRNHTNAMYVATVHFPSTSALKGHMRIHSGDKPFKCNLCESAFRKLLSFRIIWHFTWETLSMYIWILSNIWKDSIAGHKLKRYAKIYTWIWSFICEIYLHFESFHKKSIVSGTIIHFWIHQFTTLLLLSNPKLLCIFFVDWL